MSTESGTGKGLGELSMGQTTGLAVLIGYVVLFLGLVLLDQTTKFHSEKAFMTWSHETDLRSFRSTSTHIFALGVPPGVVDASGDGLEVSKNWLDVQLTYVRNPGAAWGSFGNLPDSFRLALFYGITIFVTGFILYLLKTSHSGQRLARTALIFILSGAVGNVVDRLLLTYVIDWIHFHWLIFGWEYSFPVFNVADIAINVGVALMLLDIVITELQLKSYGKKVAALPSGSTPPAVSKESI
jgi:signal peptidase II